jgi:predicted nucleic acid binding AN1-type Zn finger protein
VGATCHLAECRMRDFLPFTCKQCGNTFCLDHRAPDAHRCSADPHDNRALFCPICKQQVLVRAGEDAQTNLARHATSRCTQHSTAPSAQQRHACSAPRCSRRSDVPFLCSICEAQFCLTHRAPDSHACPGPKQQSGICVLS